MQLWQWTVVVTVTMMMVMMVLMGMVLMEMVLTLMVLVLVLVLMGMVLAHPCSSGSGRRSSSSRRCSRPTGSSGWTTEQLIGTCTFGRTAGRTGWELRAARRA